MNIVSRKYREWNRPAAGGEPVAEKRMRALAMGLRVDSRARLYFPRREIRLLRALARRAQALSGECRSLAPAMEWLNDNARRMEAYCQQARAERGGRLPAVQGLPRVALLARSLLEGGGAALTQAGLEGALLAFDDVQALTMAELWAMAAALRIELCHCFIGVAREALAGEEERLAAQRWVDAGAPKGELGGKARGSAFFARALQLVSELEMADARQAIERHLVQHDASAERVIALAHERQAMERMRMENLFAAKQLVDSLDWLEVFGRVSRAEQELNRDPSGAYPRMEEASKAQVRERVRMLANRLELGEATVARQAVAAAQKEEGARGCACWWLCDDAGCAEFKNQIGAGDVRVRALSPDPEGYGYMGCVLAAALVVWLAFAWCSRSVGLSLLAIPVAWAAGAAVVQAILPRLVPPARLLKLELEHIPREMATLVTIPALLSSPARAQELARQLEVLGCMEEEENIGFLLLGDFRDAERQSLPEDETILATVRAQIRAMNERAGREKYFFLHRERAHNPADGAWMGRERKRGALMDLYRLLLTGENAFSAEGACAPKLAGRYPYVLTLDADTRMLPGTARRLIGTIAHPVNRAREENGKRRGYALIQPRMELSLRAASSEFIRLMAGEGGVDSYPVSVSDAYQDITGQGIFGGKGIVDVRAFVEAVEGQLPDNAILSHDLIEGLYAGCGFASDITLYDGFPSTLGGYFKRLERWTRGDWQLLRFLGRRAFTALDRYKMIDNLRRSLAAPAAFALIALGLWLDARSALAMGLLLPFLPALLHPLRAGKRGWKRAFAHLALLSMEAGAQLAAIARALRRSFFTHAHMLEWVPSADAEGGAKAMASRIGAILLLPGLANLPLALFALALGALFLLAPSWLRGMEKPDAPPTPDAAQAEFLRELARDTWRYFETYVQGALPPDNVQLDPPVPPARRTSPTNTGLYLLACLCARLNGFIDEAEMRARMEKTVRALEAMPKWKGHPYNWCDTQTLQPLRPKYVSSVDSGNLLACLLLCAQAVGGALAERMRALAKEMDFRALYDKKRELFVIGVDVEREKPSNAHYDLLASESRILSFAAILCGGAPVKHFARLARGLAVTRQGSALLSWSGTMFEYLMPELFLRAPRGSLLEQSNRAVVRLQKAEGERLGRAWGVSESGYYAFDRDLNYQYRAFGYAQLAMSASAQADVVAPYAAALALPLDLSAACENLRRMSHLGWRGACGLYEAVDFRKGRLPEGAECAVVYSHMTHHQGMILAALTNALCADALVRLFFAQPRAQALSLLLEEKPAAPVRLRARRAMAAPGRVEAAQRHTARRGTREFWPDMHALYGRNATALVSTLGQGFLRAGGVFANRWTGDMLRRPEGLYVHVEEVGGTRTFLASGQQECPDWLRQTVSFEAGRAQWMSRAGAFSCCLEVCVSPEDGAYVQWLEVENTSSAPVRLRVTSAFSVALMDGAELAAHPAFYALFVQSALAREGALRFTRRPRAPGEAFPVLLHAAAGNARLSYETDLARLVGRDGALGRPGGLAQSLSGTMGSVLNPCSALRMEFQLLPGEKTSICFYIGLCEPEREADWLNRHQGAGAALRARQLAQTQAVAALEHTGIGDALHHTLQRATAFLVDWRLSGAGKRLEPTPVRDLWALGVSGDLPILAVHISEKAQLDLAREAVRAHEFYHAMGLWADLLLINEYGNDYEQPVRDALGEIVSASTLREWQGKPGGVYLLEGAQLDGRARERISAFAALEFTGGEGSLTRQMRARWQRLRVAPSARGVPAPADGYVPPMLARGLFNGYGGFVPDGYCVDVFPGAATPAPWANILANPHFGALVTERGGGFTWYKNSRFGRLTPFDNDPLREGWGEMLYVLEGEEYFLALPGPRPGRAYRALHAQGYSVFETGTEALHARLTVFVDEKWPVKWLLLALENRTGAEKRLEVRLAVDWLMGVNAADGRVLRSEARAGALFASGAMEGVAFAAILADGAAAVGNLRDFLGSGGLICPDGLLARSAGGDVLAAPLTVPAGARVSLACAIGCADDLAGADALLEEVRAARAEERLADVCRAWQERLSRLEIVTPDEPLNAMLTRFLPYQAFAGRIWGRTGLYQAGGAYGFRDQLQDMLIAMLYEPELAREHILLCAAHQFEDGDVMHWWHPERLGVRTRISDDMLFLPYVTAAYVEYTGDRDILRERVAYLKNVEIPEGREDWYGEAQVSEKEETLQEHCLRAIRRASLPGEHGLILMGSGDWNDGMNRIGARGRGESVWLTQFLSVVARRFGRLTGESELLSLAEKLKRVLEQCAWDGRWYLRAYDDAGNSVCGGERIDALAQSWAVFAGLQSERCESAMQSVKERLIDWDAGVLRLLAPPFDGEADTVGYIAGYVPGVRENGGQYTHAACWTGIALAELGQVEDAWRALYALMPYTHAQTGEGARRYIVEPYVVAGDVYGTPPHTGRGGWTWYTGAAGWLAQFGLRLLGYERKGNFASLRALLPPQWQEVRLKVRVGASAYTLISRRGAPERSAVELIDDGQEHTEVFPARGAGKA